MRDHVTTPLETLLGLFQNPLRLIQKRKDKLLDYDHMQYALDHAEDSEKIDQLREELLLAKRNYEALNTQLLEELPCFIEAVLNMLKHQLTVLVQAQYTFSASVAALLPPLLPPSSTPDTSLEIQQEHAEQLVTVCKDLSRLSLVPTSLSMNFSMRTGHRTSSTTSPQHNSSSDSCHTPPSAGECVALLGKEEEDIDEMVEEELPSKGSRLQVLFDFVGQDSAELSVSSGQVVVLVCPHDRIGCKEWWLVQVEEEDLNREGYVPAAYLAGDTAIS